MDESLTMFRDELQRQGIESEPWQSGGGLVILRGEFGDGWFFLVTDERGESNAHFAVGIYHDDLLSEGTMARFYAHAPAAAQAAAPLLKRFSGQAVAVA